MQDAPLNPGKALLGKVAKGDKNSFRALFDLYRNQIYYFARTLIKSETEAEDILQEVFLKVWVNRHKLAQIENFKAYLYTLARNHIYNLLRKQANEELFLSRLSAGMGETTGQSPALHNLSFNELHSALQKATAALTPQQKQVFELSRIEGLKHKEIAARLGISQNTVKKHMADALRTIRFSMQPYNKVVSMALLLFLLHS